VSGRAAADTWATVQFWIATSDGLKRVSGYTLAGLGLHRDGAAQGGSRTRWALTHLGSGGKIIGLPGTIGTAMLVATKIARCGDWTLFDMADGWKQTDPGLQGRVAEILTSHGVKMKPTPDDLRITANEARAVVAAREADDAR